MALHQCIEFCIYLLKNSDLKGIQTYTNDKDNKHFHNIQVSYVEYLSEADNLLSVKRLQRTYHPCHKCLAQTETFSDCNSVKEQTIAHTLNFLETFHRTVDKT